MNLARKIPVICIAIAVALIAGHATAADPPKTEARVTQIIKDVKLLSFKSPARPAAVNDEVRENTAVRTGDESRSELTFEDLTITRLGANTIFSFNKAGRSGTLGSGAVLLRVPKDSGGAEFKTNAVTVGITGTTVIFEFVGKLTVLEGNARLTLNKFPDESAEIRAGQMLDVKAGATKMPRPADVDLDRLMRTSPLITDFPPLPSQDLILAAIRDQQTSASGGSPVSGRTPRAFKSPTPAATVTFTPPPRPIFTPRFVPSPPLRTPTPPPDQTTTPPPKPTPRSFPTKTPKGTPRPSPRSTRTPTGNLVRPPYQTIKPPDTSTPTPSPRIKKSLRKATPTPSPTPPVIR